MMMNKTQTQNKSQYELSRDERIKANLERMQKLGLADISLELKSQFQAKRATKSFSNRTTPSSVASPIRRPGPIRRSSRLQNSTPVSYTEAPLGKKDEGKEMGSIMLEEGARPEIYTEEHEKLLGHTEKSWTLFGDGYGKDGKRLYDPVRGKTCHQCRQKTLGYRTQCRQCNRLHGQFCGDCLYMRYGEHVLEAIENPKWICPVCRGICNCSFCRTAKGWPPTGLLYRKIVQLGFKSVAHYLIQTRRAETSLVQNPETPEQVSGRRLLPFPDTDEENLKADHNDLGPLTSLGEQKGDNEFKCEKEDEKQNNADLDINNQASAKRTLSFPDIDHMVGDHLGLPKLQSESSTGDHKEEEESKVDCVDLKLGDSTNGLETASKPKKKWARDNEPSADSIGGRLRRRCQKEAEHDDDSSDAKDKIPDGKQDANKILSETEVKKEICVLFTDSKDGGDSSTVLKGSSKLKKRIRVAEPSADSVAGRLRQRRKGN
ncbi:putative transcription factor C2H2 family [Rosa chinensis]|uniref:Putative transcription factor C2H2 family n=1 Tax=Rosa chinensis TaxID=74649 RepID=A0A2P6RMZ9_ROSCH|nr:uncharacterized protein LOC112189428 [Rosa chinensis]PRQ47806.1 putative transcription factor C2H2 family [Rosa chinensis]